MAVDMSSAFGQMWQFLSQRFLLFFQWTDQITIGGVSLLKIGIGLTVLTIVIAVVLPIIRTTPVNAGLGASRPDSVPSGPDRDSYEYYAARRERLDSFRDRYDRERFD